MAKPFRLPSTMARLEPLTMLSALAVNTKRIGLAAAASLEEAKALWK